MSNTARYIARTHRPLLARHLLVRIPYGAIDLKRLVPVGPARQLNIDYSLAQLVYQPIASVHSMAIPRSTDPLVWIDCEMTGLDHETDSILSISCFITDYQLNLLDEEGFDVVIHHDKAQLSQMGEWCTRTHGQSGLTQAAIDSTTTATEAAQSLLTYIKKYVPEPRTALLAGNSIHADKMFLSKKPFSVILAHLHYRLLDVSTIKEAVRRWGSDELLQGIPSKKGLHQAREDILESMEEARYYQRFFQSDQ